MLPKAGAVLPVFLQPEIHRVLNEHNSTPCLVVMRWESPDSNWPVPKTDMLFGPGDGFKAAMRHAFGKPIPSFQGLQWELADVVTDLEAARLLTY